jgi:hydrogenase expression/formation protein HypC
MCLAIPMRLVERRDFEGEVELNGVRRKISLMLFPEADVGEFVLVHAGYAIGKLDEEEARQTIALLEEMARAAGEEPA